MNIEELKKQGKTDDTLNPFYISFSDLMVLLCVFFVMLLGMSSINRGTFEQLRSGFTGDSSGTLVELSKDLQGIAQNINGVSVNMTKDGVRLDLQSAALFDTKSAIIKSNALRSASPLLKRLLKTPYIIDVEGHSDDQYYYETKKTKNGLEIESNWSLSGRRASSVVQYLVDFGFPDSKLRIVGYAANKPKTPIGNIRTKNELKSARQQNRRVSLLVH